MKIIKIDEYNIMMQFDAEEVSLFFPRGDGKRTADAATHLARAAGMARGARITYLPSSAGAVLFVTAENSGAGGVLKERYIYKFDDTRSFLALCRETSALFDPPVMTDGESFYIVFSEDVPYAGEFGGVMQQAERFDALFERLRAVNIGTERLGELAL